MKYFVGSYENKVDIKSRVSLPSHFRDVLNIKKSNTFYIFPSPNKDCLEAGGQDLIDVIIHSIEENAPMFSNEEETFNYIIANARPFSFDSTGRFVLPEEFSSFAKISTSAMFVGSGRRFQIWNPDNYKIKNQDSRKHFAEKGLTIKKPSEVVND